MIKKQKKDWDDIKDDYLVNLKKGDLFVENIRIKFFNQKILEDNLSDIRLKLILQNYNTEYLSIKGIKIDSIIYQNLEVQKQFKDDLFNLMSSKIIKENFQKYEPRFEHDKVKYAFEGFFRKEIFDEIWDQIIFIPFLNKDITGYTERSNYSIFIDSNINDSVNTNKKLAYLDSLLNDLYHDFFHILAIFYSINLLKYDINNFNTIEFLPEEIVNEIKFIYEQNKIYYPKETICEYDINDMGDIMEISL